MIKKTFNIKNAIKKRKISKLVNSSDLLMVTVINGETKMQIELTQDQYRKLIELIYMGERMTNGWRQKPLDRYKDLEQYIYSFAKENGITENEIEFDNQLKKYYVNKPFLKEVEKLIAEYHEMTKKYY